VIKAVFAGLQAMQYTSLDYTSDRIDGLEREMAWLKEELRQIRRSQAPGGTYDGEAIGPTG
jgi:hypothetical protein